MSSKNYVCVRLNTGEVKRLLREDAHKLVSNLKATYTTRKTWKSEVRDAGKKLDNPPSKVTVKKSRKNVKGKARKTLEKTPDMPLDK